MIVEAVKIFNIIFKFCLFLCIFRLILEGLSCLCQPRSLPPQTVTNLSQQSSQSSSPQQRPQQPQECRRRTNVKQKNLDSRDIVHLEEVWGDNQRKTERKSKESEKKTDSKESPTPLQRVRPPIRKYQNYTELLKQCQESRIFFEDPEFQRKLSSLFYNDATRKFKEKVIHEDTGRPETWRWIRATDIATRPQFYARSQSPSRLNVLQGGFGNCWFVAAIAVISMYPDLMRRVAPSQTFDPKTYAGIFHFHFWLFGTWIDVVVDDFLPCINRQPYSVHSENSNEFVYSLLEKAYAKMNGTYEALESGTSSEAFIDLTGGISESYKLQNTPEVRALFTDLMESYQMESLIACYTHPDPTGEEKKLPNGLVTSHAYSVTNVCQIVVEKRDEQGNMDSPYVELMIRIRNPWGQVEWNGPWSDGSKEWEWVSEETKNDIGVSHQEDGEFWMTYDDFISSFYAFEIVHLTRYVHLVPSSKIPWDFATFHGEWVSGVTNGGGENMDINPQYRITLTEPDKLIKDGKCTMLIALMQKYRRIMREMGLKNLAIGFDVYHLPPSYQNVAPAPKRFFQTIRPVERRAWVRQREVSSRIRVPPGPYLIVPYAYNGEEAQFLLRVFTSGHANMRENDRPLDAPSLPRQLDNSVDENINSEVRRFIDVFHRYQVAEIGWKHLKIIMDNFGSSVPHFKGFNKETVRSAIAMVDEDQNGKIDYREFITLFSFLELIKRTFMEEDKDKKGVLPPFRFQNVMAESGYDLPQSAISMLSHRYARSDGSFHFDDFLLCMIKTRQLNDTFEYNQTDAGFVQFNFQDWFVATIFT